MYVMIYSLLYLRFVYRDFGSYTVGGVDTGFDNHSNVCIIKRRKAQYDFTLLPNKSYYFLLA